MGGQGIQAPEINALAFTKQNLQRDHQAEIRKILSGLKKNDDMEDEVYRTLRQLQLSDTVIGSSKPANLGSSPSVMLHTAQYAGLHASAQPARLPSPTKKPSATGAALNQKSGYLFAPRRFLVENICGFASIGKKARGTRRPTKMSPYSPAPTRGDA